MNVVAHNLQAMNSKRQLGIVSGGSAKSTEKLSSGYRINRAADDAAGLAISEKMRTQIRGLDKAAKNIQDGISFVQVADGALAEVHSMIHRMKELATQASNDTNTEIDRSQLNGEVRQLKKEISRIFNTTEFNTHNIFKSPYTLGVDDYPEPQDIQLFNTSENGGVEDTGGIIVNSRRYTWSEMGANIQGGVFQTNWEADITDDLGERIHMFANAGDGVEDVFRRYHMTADNEGVYINEVPAAHWIETEDDGKWAGKPAIPGEDEYAFEYNGMLVSFSPDDDDDRKKMIERLNPDELNDENHVLYWDVKVDESYNEYAVSSGGGSFTLDVTGANKGSIEGWSYEISADETGVTLRQTSGSDGITHKKIRWDEFVNTASGESFRFTDWGLSSTGGAQSQTFDHDAVYVYQDNTHRDMEEAICFSFRVSDESSREGIMNGLNGITLRAGSVSSPMQSFVTTSNTDRVSITNWSNMDNFHFQRDKLGRSFNDEPSVSAVSGSIVRTMVSDGTVSSYINKDDEWVEKYKYNKCHYEYEYRNSAGEAIFKASSGSFLDLSDGRVWDEEAGTYTNVAHGSTVNVTDSNGYITSYDSNFQNRNITMTYTGTYDGTGGRPSFTVRYDDRSSSAGNLTTNTSMTPADEAKLTFTKPQANKGSNLHTKYEAEVPPPPEKLLHIQSGSQPWQSIDLIWRGMTLSSIGLGAANVTTYDRAQKTMEMADKATDIVSSARANFGAYQNRLEHAYDIDNNIAENIQASESRIRDTDMADEMVNFSKHKILQQVGQSMLSQANQAQELIMALVS